MRLTVWGRTETGRHRHTNEDRVLVDTERRIFAVADGLSGHPAGEVASEMATYLFHQRVQDLPVGDSEHAEQREALMQGLPALLDVVSAAIYDAGQAEISQRGMSSTLASLILLEEEAVIAHVGDSRVYLIREGHIYQATEDHTLVQQLLKRGVLEPQNVDAFPHRHIVQHSLGHSPAVEADVVRLDVQPGDRFILCTDGLTDCVSDEEIRTIVLQHPPKTATEELTALANTRSGSGNISIIVVEVPENKAAVRQIGTEEKVSLLRNVYLFSELSFQESLRFLAMVEEERFRPGEVIILEGDVGHTLYVLLQGKVDVTREGVQLAQIGSGGHFGELGVISGGARTATVSATSDVLLLALDEKRFFDLVARDNHVAVKLLWRFLQYLGGRLNILAGEFAEVVKQSRLT